MSKRQKQGGLKVELNQLSDEVVRIFRQHKSAKSLNYREIAAKLKIRDEFSLEMIIQVLEKLERQEILEAEKPGSFRLKQEADTLEGTLSMTQKVLASWWLRAVKTTFLYPKANSVMP